MHRLTMLLRLDVDGRPVAAARVMLAFALSVCVLESAGVLSGIAGGKLRYPALLPAPTSASVQIFLVVGLLAAAFLLVGILASGAAAVGSALLTAALLWDQQTYSSHHLLITLLLAYLSFARSGERGSLARHRSPDRSDVPWWPQLLMMTQVSALYLFAGLSKMNPRFVSGRPLQDWMWLEGPLWLFQALAVATIVTEMFLAFALWVPRLRVAAVIAGVALHLGILFGLSDQTVVLIAFAAASLSTYWLFLSRPPLRDTSGDEAIVGVHGADAVPR